MFRFARPTSLLAAASLATLVAACAQTGAGGATPTPAPPAATQMASEGAAGSAAVITIDLQQGDVGSFLTGKAGRTLYVFAKDTANTSSCSGTCATTWPPFTLGSGETAVAGTGVSGTVGMLTRSDGSTQVTINGKPVYYFSGDSAAGDTNGQGFDGLWYVADADGSPVQGSAPATGGYGY
jgi:predicted lipoprotein with Yx(FWY)xxD motif